MQELPDWPPTADSPSRAPLQATIEWNDPPSARLPDESLRASASASGRHLFAAVRPAATARPRRPARRSLAMMNITALLNLDAQLVLFFYEFLHVQHEPATTTTASADADRWWPRLSLREAAGRADTMHTRRRAADLPSLTIVPQRRLEHTCQYSSTASESVTTCLI